MKELAVQVLRCVDDEHQPGWIECKFIDAQGRSHTVIDKIPIFGMDPALDSLDRNAKYPQPGGSRAKFWAPGAILKVAT
jgi:hypothetical protein